MTVLSVNELRERALAARDALDGDASDRRKAAMHIERLLDLLPEPSDAPQGSVPRGPSEAAITAALDALTASGVQDPVVVLIVQENQAQGPSPRSLVSNAANPVDLLRVTVENVKARGLW